MFKHATNSLRWYLGQDGAGLSAVALIAMISVLPIAKLLAVSPFAG
jgi:hypothetical protein